MQALVKEASHELRRARDGCLSILSIYRTVEDWVEDCPDADQYVVRVHDGVREALSVMMAGGEAEPPEVLGLLTDQTLDSRYSWETLTCSSQAEVTNILNYVAAERVARTIVGAKMGRHHRNLRETASEAYWTGFRAGMGRYREPWDALCLLLSVAFGDHAEVIERFDRELHFELAAHENASRTLAKQAYLLGKYGSGTADEAMQDGVKALLLITQLNYFRWIARDQEDARVDLVAVVLATQLYQEIIGPKAESIEAFLHALSPAVVVARMQAEVVPDGT